ncbi:MAG: RsmE family RNA methyltransferase [Thermanaerothrix sp.]|uniref:RsmE family RNA methyltransferase n=1 Tax=Thermanaerothrix sp. TaxID=2972675 RepID=UPI003C7AC329
MHRFFLPPENIGKSHVRFPAETAHQIHAVLRLRPGHEVIVLNNGGQAFRVRLEDIRPAAVTGIILDEIPLTGEPKTHLTLFIGLTQREKFEWVLQKGTEVGVSAFIPLITRRTLVREIETAHNKQGRWQRIVQEAAEQCGRGRIPKVHLPLELPQALVYPWPGPTLRLVAWENETQNGLRQILQHLPVTPQQVALMIGPEGGLSLDEVTQAQEAGWVTCSLGTRILRMETAAIVGAALTLHELGDL